MNVHRLLVLIPFALFFYLQLNLGVKPPRSWHIACTHYPSMGQSEVLLFGGNVHVKPGEMERMDYADLQILSWGRWVLIIVNDTIQPYAYKFLWDIVFANFTS